jgi:hypothetical protein
MTKQLERFLDTREGGMLSNAYLVYQADIANVFTTIDGEPYRMMQADFRTCEAYARGLRDAGVILVIKNADHRAGDIRLCPEQWRDGKGDIFRDSKNPPDPKPAPRYRGR